MTPNQVHKDLFWPLKLDHESQTLHVRLYHITGWVLEWIMGGSGGSCSAQQDAQASTAWFHSDQLRERSHRVVLFYDDLMSTLNGDTDTACFKNLRVHHGSSYMIPCHLQHLDLLFWGCAKVKRVMCIRSLCGIFMNCYRGYSTHPLTDMCFKTDGSQSCKTESLVHLGMDAV